MSLSESPQREDPTEEPLDQAEAERGFGWQEVWDRLEELKAFGELPQEVSSLVAEWLTQQWLGEPHSLRLWQSRFFEHSDRLYRRARSRQATHRWLQEWLATGRLTFEVAKSLKSVVAILPYFHELTMLKMRRADGEDGLPELPDPQWLEEARGLLTQLPPSFEFGLKMSQVFLRLVEESYPAWVTRRQEVASHALNPEVQHLLDYMGAKNWRELEEKLGELFEETYPRVEGNPTDEEVRAIARRVMLFARLSGMGSHDKAARVRRDPDSRGEVVPYAVHMMRIATAFLQFTFDLYPHAQARAEQAVFEREMASLPKILGLQELIARRRTQQRWYEKRVAEAWKEPREQVPQRLLEMGWLLVFLHDHQEDVAGFQLAYDAEKQAMVCRAPFDWPHIQQCIIPEGQHDPTQYTELFPAEWINQDREWIDQHAKSDTKQLEIAIPMREQDFEIFETLMAAITEPEQDYLKLLEKYTEYNKQPEAARPKTIGPYQPNEVASICRRVEQSKHHPTCERILRQTWEALLRAKEGDLGEYDSPEAKDESYVEKFKRIVRKFENDAYKIAHLEVVAQRLLAQFAREEEDLSAIFVDMLYLVKIQDRQESARLPKDSKPIEGVLDKAIYKRMEQALIEDWVKAIKSMLGFQMQAGNPAWPLVWIGSEIMGYQSGRVGAQERRFGEVMMLLGAGPDELYGDVQAYFARRRRLRNGTELMVPATTTPGWLSDATHAELVMSTLAFQLEPVEQAYRRYLEQSDTIDITERCHEAVALYVWTRQQWQQIDPSDQPALIRLDEALYANLLDLEALYQGASAEQKALLQEQIDAGLLLMLDSIGYILPDNVDGITAMARREFTLYWQAGKLRSMIAGREVQASEP